MAGVAILLSGCATISWYGQAARGQIDLMQKREHIADLLADPDTDEELRRQLTLVLEAREFAIEHLGLPDSRSYLRYADLERDAAVWNVIAAPRHQIEPRSWCYPIVGCLAYRGFFQRDQAQALADRLADEGYDVIVWPAVAYSTLGWFADPVLNTMLRWDDASLAGFIFHELAHEQLFVQGDTTFNESYATTVERAGLRQWLRARGELERLEQWQRERVVGQALTERMLTTREALAVIYREAANDPDGLERGRAEQFAQLQADIEDLVNAPGGERFRGWRGREINNAHLVLFASYESGVAAFKQLLAECEQDWQCFHQRSAGLAQLSFESRRRFLAGEVPFVRRESGFQD